LEDNRRPVAFLNKSLKKTSLKHCILIISL
jgi:hypothetical protein